MKILVHPRDSNPYQQELYSRISRNGHEVRYFGELTWSHSLGVALIPFELIARRITGYRVLHLHWVYRFALPGVSQLAIGRRMMRGWFALTLAVAHLTGIRVVWVAHNVLPHGQVFDDDIAARRHLLATADAIVVHERAVLRQLAELGRIPSAHYVARHPAYCIDAPDSDADGRSPLRVLFFGVISAYKGVPDLLRAAARVRKPIRLTIAGHCADPALAQEVTKLANTVPHEVRLRLERLSDEALLETVTDCDLVVLPFAAVTTSGSLLYALSAGRPVIVPDMPSLGGLPASAVTRYEPGTDPASAIAAVLDDLSAEGIDDIVGRGRAARDWAHAYTWDHLAIELAHASESDSSFEATRP